MHAALNDNDMRGLSGESHETCREHAKVKKVRNYV